MKETSQYSGAILVHARVVRDAEEIAASAGDKSKRLEFDELSRFLSLVSLCALGTQIYYDSSIPQDDADKTNQGAQSLGLSSLVKPSPPPEPEHFESDAALAVEAATELFQKAISTPLRFLKAKRVRQDRADAFFEPLKGMGRAKSQDVKSSIAREAYYNDVMGGKILIGLSDPKNEKILRELSRHAGHVAQSRPERLLVFLPQLVNTFRYFLLSDWSHNWMSLYATTVETEPVGEWHRHMVWPRIERELCGLAGWSQWPSRSRKKDPTEQVLPLVGLAALEQSKPGDGPADLFGRAEEIAKEINLKSLMTQLINSQIEYEGGSKPDEIARELLWRIKGYRRERVHPKLPSFPRRAFHEIMPDFVSTMVGVPGGYIATQQAIEAFLARPVTEWESLLAGAGGFGLVRLCWALGNHCRQRGRETDYLTTLSHLVMFAEQMPIPEVEEKVKLVWRRDLALPSRTT